MSDESQQDRATYGTDIGEVRHEPASSPWRVRIYAAVVGLVPFALLGVTFLWMGSGPYRDHAQYSYLRAVGYGAQVRGLDCEVVVEGDSTAMVGVRPEVITARTGLTACNIAEIAGVKHVNGMQILDRYLEQNSRPKYVVFLLTGENLTNPTQWTTVAAFEGLFYEEQYRGKMDSVRTILGDPNGMVTNLELGLRMGLQSQFAKPIAADPMAQRVAARGWFPEGGEPVTNCHTLNGPEREPDVAWLKHLRETYGKGGTTVLIDVTPSPSCDPTLPFYRARLTPTVVDSPGWQLPLTAYTNTGRLHVNVAGAEMLSGLLADQIAGRMKTDAKREAKPEAKGAR